MQKKKDDLKMLEDKEIITAYKTEIALKTKELNELKIKGLIGVCYNWYYPQLLLMQKKDFS